MSGRNLAPLCIEFEIRKMEERKGEKLAILPLLSAVAKPFLSVELDKHI
jgi:hypothetical protein